MTTTVSSIIAETKALVETKQAEFNKAAAIAGGDGSDYPGAECDKPVDASAGSANPEVKQDLPPNGTSAAGACEAETLEAGHTTDSTQSSGESVEKKPLDSSDANAKTASAGTSELANNLLARIKGHNEKVAAAEKRASSEEAEGEPGKPAEGEETPAEAPAEEAAPAVSEGKEAEAEVETSVDLTADVLAKIASVILSTEEGIAFVEDQMTKAAGAEAAADTIEFLQKQAAYEAGAADAEQMIFAAALQKQAAAQAEAGSGFSAEEIEKCAQALADEILAAGGEGGMGEALPPEAGGDLGTGEEGAAVAEDIAAGGDDMGDVTLEELQEALMMMVGEGAIDQATADALLQTIGGEEAGAPAPEEMEMAGAAGAEAAGGAPIPEEEGMEVAASEMSDEAKLEAKIASAVKAVRAAKTK